MARQRKQNKKTISMNIEIPQELYDKISIYSIKMSLHDRRNSVLSILTKYFEKQK